MGMIASQYKTRLNQSLKALSDANIRATNYRSFNKPSDDPFAAARTFQVRREAEQNENYQSNLSSVQSALKSAESTVQLVSEIVSNANSTRICGGITGTMTKDTRAPIVKELQSMRASILTDMNAKFSDQYLFGGAGSGAPPFSVDGDGNLLYRGVNVDTGVNMNGASAVIPGGSSPTQILFGKENAGLFNGYMIAVQTGGAGSVSVSGSGITVTLGAGHATKGDLEEALQNGLGAALAAAGKPTEGMDFSKITVAGNAEDAAATASAAISDKVSLDGLAGEGVYVDLGFGLQFNADGSVVPQSAYDASLPGIAFLGYGMNGDGVPNNVYSLLGKISDMLDSDNVSMSTIQPYLDSLKQAESNLTTQTSAIGAKETFLDSTQTYLEDVSENLTAKDNDVEYVEPSDAIIDWMTQQFCYQACLQMGTNILQPTLMDFLK